MTPDVIFISAAVVFLIAGRALSSRWPGLSSIAYSLAFFAAMLSALVGITDAHADTVAHANGMENRMLVLTDDRCSTGSGSRSGQVAIVLSFFKQAHSDAPGYIVADGCWKRESGSGDVGTIVIVWNPDGLALAYPANKFHWKGDAK